MEPINIKILPFVAAALIFSYLTFATALSLTTKIEIMLNLEQVLMFLLVFALHISLTSISISLVLSQTTNIYYRVGLFFLILLPYASVFLLQSPIDLPIMGMILVIFVAVVASVLLEFNNLYTNQIKIQLGTSARANARTLTFYVALATALVFFSVNNNPNSQIALQTKVETLLTTTITQAFEDYDIEALINAQIPAGLETTPLGRSTVNKMESQFKTMVTDQITAMIEPYMPYIIYILTFLIFGTIAGAATFAGLATILISTLVTQLLKSSGYLKETKQMVEVTRLTL